MEQVLAFGPSCDLRLPELCKFELIELEPSSNFHQVQAAGAARQHHWSRIGVTRGEIGVMLGPCARIHTAVDCMVHFT